MSITSKYLEAAILDQVVAGTFPGKRYAFVAVVNGSGWGLGVAVADEPGYNPINKVFTDQAEADEWAKGLNKHIGLTDNEAFRIVGSTMRRKPKLRVVA